MAYDCRVSDDTIVMVHELLKTEADMDGVVIISYVYVAEKLGVSDSTVSHAVEHLVSRGYIERQGRHHIHNINTLLLLDY
jgi:Mn-dependent DtxR family transcriptional regulator